MQHLSEFLSRTEIDGIPSTELLAYWMLGLSILSAVYNSIAHWRSCAYTRWPLFNLAGAAVFLLQSLSILLFGYAWIDGVAVPPAWFGPSPGAWMLTVAGTCYLFTAWQHTLLYFHQIKWVEDRAEILISRFKWAGMGIGIGALLIFIGTELLDTGIFATLGAFWSSLTGRNGTGACCIASGIVTGTAAITGQLVLYIVSLRNHPGYLAYAAAAFLAFIASTVVLLLPVTVFAALVLIGYLGLRIAGSKGSSRSDSPEAGFGQARCGDCEYFGTDGSGHFCENTAAGYGVQTHRNRTGNCPHFRKH